MACSIARARALVTLLLVAACGTSPPVDGDESTGSSNETGAPTASADSSTGSSSTSAETTEIGSSSSSTDTSDAASLTGSEDTSSTSDATDSSDADPSSSGSTSSSPAEVCASTIPEAALDRYTVAFDTDPLVVPDSGVLENDVDLDGDALHVAAFDTVSEAGGDVSVDTAGGFTYTPPDEFFGEDGFAYTVSDDNGCIASGSVRVIVYPTTIPVGNLEEGPGGFVIEGAGEGDRSGSDAAGAGDVDGDGLADIIIGAPNATVDGVANVGAAFVVFGRDSIDTVELADVEAGEGGFVLEGEAEQDYAGWSVAGAGDVNGDGLADIAIGAMQSDAQGEDTGRVYVVFGKADGAAVALGDVATGVGGFVIDGEQIDDAAGERVGGAGDVNGDGLADIIVGTGGGATTPAYVVFGKASTDPVPLADVAAGSGGFAIGPSGYPDNVLVDVSGAGDVNGDGLSDVIVGLASAWAPAGFCAGRSYVVFGRASTTAVDLPGIVEGEGGFVIEGADGSLLSGLNCSGDFSGRGVDGAGDVDGDGLSDLVIGGDENAYVVFGKSDTASVALADVEDAIGGIHIDDRAIRVAGGGDIDADGVPDIVLGGAEMPPTGGVRDYVVFGQTADASIEVADLVAGIGGFALDAWHSYHQAYRVAMLGDVNGDGYVDLAMGAPGVGETAPDAGRTYVMFGGDFNVAP